MKNGAYRVAIASTDNHHVDQHFGRAESFLIVDVDSDGNYEEIEQRFVIPVCEGGYHNGEKLKKGAEGLLDCNFVLAAKIGNGARAELEERGIFAFEIPGRVDESLKKLDSLIKLLDEMNSSAQVSK
ncbi:NifB/NifX family molybdenum-iron cluster-binding protein [Butyrivibrio sp. YAB3001]|uniref:NifB/NifX family molybdenum-iron cluster-binding protein n=1 Tax=Butyrivibrio sp. YAB3001 TaxID=1520812 RepID=UPI0008F64C47|nr:NifB/NifX family molybdenum-iron cluster-binding protein [Butyrivibrio sp. YAB3001]SFB85481.1 Predicted Fe-Mo cluster-binding protein, NifX family [Butyrivibrio sp. YAB3001]